MHVLYGSDFAWLPAEIVIYYKGAGHPVHTPAKEEHLLSHVDRLIFAWIFEGFPAWPSRG